MNPVLGRRAILVLLGGALVPAQVRAARERWTEYTRIAGIQPE